jgi:hypothetical protein
MVAIYISTFRLTVTFFRDVTLLMYGMIQSPAATAIDWPVTSLFVDE